MPLQVLDVAQVLSNFTTLSLPGQTLNLPGPTRYSYNDILDIIASLTYHDTTRAPVIPKRLALLASRIAQRAWWPLLSPDEVERRYLDDVEVGEGDWALAGVTPEHLENVAITYVRRYRSAYVYLDLLDCP